MLTALVSAFNVTVFREQVVVSRRRKALVTTVGYYKSLSVNRISPNATKVVN